MVNKKNTIVKVLTLFDPDKFFERKSAQETEVTQDLRDYLLQYRQIIHEAFEYLQEDLGRNLPHYRINKHPATVMSGFIKGLLIDRFGVENVRRIKYDVIVHTVENKYQLRFKKLDKKFLPKNAITVNSLAERYQRSRSENEDETVLYVGYTVDKAWSHLLGTYVVCTKTDKSLLWRINLDDSAEDLELSNQIDLSPLIDVPIDEESLVKPKKVKSEQG